MDVSWWGATTDSRGGLYFYFLFILLLLLQSNNSKLKPQGSSKNHKVHLKTKHKNIDVLVVLLNYVNDPQL